MQDRARALEIDADLEDARRDGNVQLGEGGRSDRAVRSQAVPFLEGAHGAGKGLVIRLVVERRAGEITRRRKPAPQRGDAGPRHADLQSRAGQNRRPASMRRDRPVFRERGARPRVPPVVRPRGGDGLLEPSLGQCLLDLSERTLLVERPPLEVPVRIERLRIHFSEVQVVKKHREGVGREEVQVRAHRGIGGVRARAYGRREPGERFEVVVAGRQPVLRGIAQESLQRVPPLRRPVRAVAVVLVETRERLARHERRVVHGEAPGRLPLFEPFADAVGDPVRGVLRERGAGEREEKRRGDHGLSPHRGRRAITSCSGGAAEGEAFR